LNWRAAGCLVIGSLVFIGIGLLGLSLATSRTGCFDELQTAGGVYRAAAGPGASPALPGGGEAKQIGTTLVGLSTRKVYGPADTDVTDPQARRPAELAVECGDGTFRSYLLEPGGPAAS
jgi:hypothetical protein